MTALRIKHNGIRPIAVGNVLYRLASAIAMRRVMPFLRYQLSSFQIGVVFRGVCEAAINAIYSVLDHHPRCEVGIGIKLVIRHEIISVHRNYILEVCAI